MVLAQGCILIKLDAADGGIAAMLPILRQGLY